MNKMLAILVVVVVACAMGLVLFANIQGELETSPAVKPANQESLNNSSKLNQNTTLEDNNNEITNSTAKTKQDAPKLNNKVILDNQSQVNLKPNTVKRRIEVGESPRRSELKSSEVTDRAKALEEESKKDAEKAKAAELAAKKEAEKAKAAELAAKKEAEKAKAAELAAKKEAEKAKALEEEVKEDQGSETRVLADSVEESKIDRSKLPTNENHTLTNFSFNFDGRKIIVNLAADTPFPYKYFSLKDPERLVVDLPGKWSNINIPNIPENKVIKNIRLGNQALGPRLVFDLYGVLKVREVIPVGANALKIILE